MTRKFFAALVAALSVVIFSAAQVSAKAPLADIGIYKFFLNLGYKIDENALLFDPRTNQILFAVDLNEEVTVPFEFMQPYLPPDFPIIRNTMVYADKQSGKITELYFVFHTNKGKGKIAKFLSKVFNALDGDTFSANKAQIERNIDEVLKGYGNVGLGDLSTALGDADTKSFFLESANRGYTLSKQYTSEKILTVHVQSADPSLRENLLREAKAQGTAELVKQLEPLLKSKKYSEAADLCKTVIQRHPDDGAGYYGLGCCYFLTGKHSEAIEQFKKSASLTPYSETYRYMGLSYMGINDGNNAVAAFQKAVELNPQNHQAYFYQGMAYLNLLNAPDKAAECCEKAIAIYPRREFDYYYVLGFACVDAQKYSRAIEVFNEAVKLNAKDFRTYMWRGLAYEQTGNLKQAKSDYETALKLNPNLEGAAELRQKIQSLKV